MICAREGGQARPDKRKDLNEIKAAVDLDGNGLLSHIVAKFFRIIQNSPTTPAKPAKIRECVTDRYILQNQPGGIRNPGPGSPESRRPAKNAGEERQAARNGGGIIGGIINVDR